jgi:hypothetical protein
MRKISLLLLPGALMMAGCAGGPGPASTAASLQQDSTPAGKLASSLVAADAAAADRDPRALAQALARIDGHGAKPLDVASSKLLAQWHRMVDPANPPMRGPALGPGFRSGALPAGKRTAIEQTFLSGRKATIAVSVAGRAGVRLEVRGGRDQSICSEEGARNRCQWIPTFTERHRIELSNPGESTVRYYLVIE